jgi:Na+/H+ antiporter NhaD/arsenite permease-like protein
MKTAVVAIFVLTYVLIAARRLHVLPIGRSAGALLGAVLMVAVGALTPQESYRAIDHDTIVLLFGMMLLTVYLEGAGFFSRTARLLLRSCGSPRALLAATAVLSGALSAFLVNDSVCLFLTPVVVAACTRARLPLGPFLLALATSANIGSAATIVGNPQNMIVGSLSGIPFADFLLCAAPAAAVGLAINVALLQLYYGRKLPGAWAPPGEGSPPAGGERGFVLVSLVTLAVIAAFFAGLHLGYSAVAGALALMLFRREDARAVFARVDWPLLVLFCALFIVVKAFASTGVVDEVWTRAAPRMDLDQLGGLTLFSAVMVAGSNLVSNVPMVLLTGPYLDELGSQRLGWVLLAFTTTVAGNLTLIGSVANIIVAEGARDHYELGFFEYLRFGLVSTLLVLAAGIAVLVFWMGLVG